MAGKHSGILLCAWLAAAAARAAFDAGDAPESYRTVLTNSGPTHVLKDGCFLGDAVDAETNGQPEAAALGDDLAGLDDEDGAAPVGPWCVGVSNLIEVTASTSGYVSAWFDFNHDGDWSGDDNAAEKILRNVAVAAGTNRLAFGAPYDAALGWSFLRVRFTAEDQGAGGVHSWGAAASGEVEDHCLALTWPADLDFGDAPDSFRTTMATNGPRHRFVPGVCLGTDVDVDPDGLPGAAADGDDAAGDDENGVSLPGLLVAGSIAALDVVASTAGYVSAWIDFNRDQDWTADYEDKILKNKPVTAGTNHLSFTVPADAVLGPAVARFRFTTADYGDNGIFAFGFAPDGEVEDYLLTIYAPTGEDFGDAPATYATLLANGGARHTVQPGVMLGTKVDTDTNGVPSALADGDDRTGADDEDGVLFNPPYEAGGQGVVDVEASTGGYLYAWMDFNADGSFTGAGERVWNGKALTAGVNRLSFTANALAATGTPIVSRFRFTRGLVPLSFTGLAPDGEVEDHVFTVQAAADRDADGLPDYWEVLCCGDATGALPHVDSDGDGFDQAAEFTADTLPGDGQSYPRLSRIAKLPTGFAVGFSGSVQRLYTLSIASNLYDDASWQNVEIRQQGQGVAHTVRVTNDAPAIFRFHVQAGP